MKHILINLKNIYSIHSESVSSTRPIIAEIYART